jgi:hypothetical protein
MLAVRVRGCTSDGLGVAPGKLIMRGSAEGCRYGEDRLGGLGQVTVWVVGLQIFLPTRAECCVLTNCGSVLGITTGWESGYR